MGRTFSRMQKQVKGIGGKYHDVHFGEIYTDLSDPEKLINMVYYIIGEEVISEAMESIPGFYNNWNNTADDYSNSILIKALENMKE